MPLFFAGLLPLGCSQGGVDFRAVETDDDLSVDIEHRDAHLAGLGNGFGRVVRVAFDVAVFVLNALLVQVVFRGVAKGTPGRAVDDYVAHVISIASILYFV